MLASMIEDELAEWNGTNVPKVSMTVVYDLVYLFSKVPLLNRFLFLAFLLKKLCSRFQISVADLARRPPLRNALVQLGTSGDLGDGLGPRNPAHPRAGADQGRNPQRNGWNCLFLFGREGEVLSSADWGRKGKNISQEKRHRPTVFGRPEPCVRVWSSPCLLSSSCPPVVLLAMLANPVSSGPVLLLSSDSARELCVLLVSSCLAPPLVLLLSFKPPCLRRPSGWPPRLQTFRRRLVDSTSVFGPREVRVRLVQLWPISYTGSTTYKGRTILALRCNSIALSVPVTDHYDATWSQGHTSATWNGGPA